MNRLIPILGIVLAGQLGLAALLGLTGGRELEAAPGGEPLLAFDRARVDRITIEAPDEARLVLAKQDGMWRLPDHYGFPAATAKIDQLLDTLAGLEPRLPVATSESAAERFKVGEEKFERRLVLAAGKETLAQLRLGDSPGFRRVYARAGNGPVYEIELGTHEASTRTDDWIDRGYLRIGEEDVVRAECPGFALERKDDKWELAGLKRDEETSQDEASAAVRRLAGIELQSVLGKENKPEYRQSSPVLRCTLALKSGDTRTYVISKPKDGDGYVLKSSAHDYYFRLADYTVDALKDVKRAQLAQAKTRPDKEG